METRAVRDGNDWVITGRKLWITNAQFADIAIVWARTGEGTDGFSGFVVERGMKGFTTGDIPNKLSMRASATGALFLDEVRVPEANRLPGANGIKAPLQCLNNARLGIAFGVIGAGRACLEQAIAYTREREQFGVAIASKQLVQSELADIATEICEGVDPHAALLPPEGRWFAPARAGQHRQAEQLPHRAGRRAAIARATRSERNRREYHVMRHSMNLESTYTYEGTDQVHTLSIGRALTGFGAF